jgi:hypothetical protein
MWECSQPTKNKRESCRPLYNQLQILTLPSQYIFSLLMFVVKNKDLFFLNSEIHTMKTRNNPNLHMPNINLSISQKGVLCSGCKIYNKLPPHIKGLSKDLMRFISTLKTFLMKRTLYSIDEFYQVAWNDNNSCQGYGPCMRYTVICTLLAFGWPVVTMIPTKFMMNVYCILWIVLYLFLCFTCSMSAEMCIEGRKTDIILVNLKFVLNKKSRRSPGIF